MACECWVRWLLQETLLFKVLQSGQAERLCSHGCVCCAWMPQILAGASKVLWWGY